MPSSVSTWITWAELALFASLLTTSRAQIQVPENLAVLEGSDVSFYFTTPIFFHVSWLEYSTNPSGNIVFVNGTKFYSGDPAKGDRYSQQMVALPDGSNVLHTFRIAGIQREDAGNYEAKELISNNEKTAEVVVLGRGVVCTMVNENPSLTVNPVSAGERLNVTCTVPYDGKWGPYINCTGDRVSSWVVMDESLPSMSQWRFVGDIVDDIPVGSITCEAYFLNPTPSESLADAADNVISYTSSWSSGPFDIYYPATSIAILSPQPIYDVSDGITCQSMGGNPAATYTWVNSTNGDFLTSSNILTIPTTMAGNSHNITCIATTTIRGVPYENSTVITFTVNELPVITTPGMTTPGGTPGGNTTPTGGDDETTAIENELLIIIIVSVIAGVLALVLIIVLVVCCVKKVGYEKM